MRALILALLMCLVPGLAAAQAGCVAPGSVLAFEARGLPPRPQGEIVLLTRPARALDLRRWQAGRIEVALPRQGLRAGARYRIGWQAPGAAPRPLGEVTICAAETRPARPARPETATRRPNPDRAPADVVPAPDGSPEYLVSVSAAQAQAAGAALTAQGATLLRSRSLPALGETLLIFAFPAGLSLAEARSLLAQAAPTAQIDLHHVYGYAQSPRLYAAAMIGDDPGRACRLDRPVRIGVIDGPVNPGHPALQGVRLSRRSVLAEGERPAPPDHGTAVVQIIAGPGPGPLSGFAAGAEVLAAAAFGAVRGRPGARLENVGAGLDWLTAQRVRLVNLSMSGAPNRAFARLLALSAGRGAVLVAAAGNDGLSRPQYPAAAPETIAVTAVDAAGRLYRRANRGPHIEFAAPGVDLYVAGAGGGGYRSGTSYAAPIVTAVLARAAQRGALSLDAARRALQQGARDLGPAGRDSAHGHGLISGGCR
jgi:subtilisin family serine protease